MQESCVSSLTLVADTLALCPYCYISGGKRPSQANKGPSHADKRPFQAGNGPSVDFRGLLLAWNAPSRSESAHFLPEKPPFGPQWSCSGLRGPCAGLKAERCLFWPERPLFRLRRYVCTYPQPKRAVHQPERIVRL